MVKNFPFIIRLYQAYRALRVKMKGVRECSLKELLSRYNEHQLSVKFLQIGSNDGISGRDPINHFVVNSNWKGILVEPVKYLFNRLQETYQNQRNRLIFENVAIGDSEGVLKFYRVDMEAFPELPRWMEQIGSFNRRVLERHIEGYTHAEDVILEEDVKILSVSELVEKHNYKDVAIIHIDVEGYDHHILRQIDFNQIQPHIIIFEDGNMSISDYLGVIDLLKSNGYKLFYDPNERDTIALFEPYIQKEPWLSDLLYGQAT